MILRSVGRKLARSPGWQTVLGATLLALAFPGFASGAIGLLAIAAAIGVGVALYWHRLPDILREPPPRLAGALVVTVVLALGASVFWETMTESPDWQMGDWGPQRAVLAHAMSALPGTDLPVWNHTVGTGDAPFELYPKLTYLVTGHVAVALGLEDDLPLAMMIVAVIVHLAIAALTAMLAMRVAPKPIALLVGTLAIVDSGAVAHGGSVGLFRWALLHSAMSLAFTTAAALGILAALRKPRVTASATIWICIALACATHPAGLIAAAAALVGLAAVALLASDVPPRRAFAAMLHVLLGIALGAAVWMPLAERILEYGQHFPNAIRSPAKLLEDLLSWVSPITSYSMLGYAGYLGILAGLWSRRAAIVFISATALILLVGLCDAGYLAFDLAPGQGVARLGTERLAQLARPFVMVAGAYGIAVIVAAARSGWRGADRRSRLVAAALCGVMAACVFRVVPTMWRSASNRAYAESQVVAPDPIGRAALVAWAADRARELRPDAWGRALFETDTHEHFHLTALTGLPTLHIGPQPDLLLRERMEDLTPSSLRRFDVRWVIAYDHSPVLGDPDTELVLGNFHIRELRNWDGKFARIESGTGEVRVTRLDDTAVEIEVTANEPVLVALGTGYYPRWRARHASGADEPVYATLATQTGTLHVVGAWVAPGKTTFTCDGPLPSDGRGRLPSLLAALLAIAIAVGWAVARWRYRILRRMAALRSRLPALVPYAARVGVPLAFLVLLVRGCRDSGAPAKALQLGSGLRPQATVQAREGDRPWQTCDYSHVFGTYRCEGLVFAFDGMATLLNDAAPSWAFNTPGILASAERPDVEIRISLEARLDGVYWTAVSDGTVDLEVTGESPRRIDRAIVTYMGGDRDVTITGRVPMTAWSFTFVEQDTLQPRREYPVPPVSAPDSIRAIR